MARKTTAKPKTSRRRTTARPATPPVAQATPATTTTPALDVDTGTPAPVADSKTFGKRELIDRVVTASGIKKKAAKPVVEAMLKELGEALSRGETLNLQPFGKGIVKTQKTLENAEVIELRLRRSKTAMQAAAPASEVASEDVSPKSMDPLAAAAE